MSLGIPRSRVVRLVPSSSTWAEEFLRERDRIVSAVGGQLRGIEHVGSTAIPGIHAKPVIDIVVAILSLELVEGPGALDGEHRL